MSRYWSNIVKTLTPYVPGEQPKISQLIKLNTNENPYPPSPQVLAALEQHSSQNLRLYPDPNSTALKQAIADYHQVTLDQVFVGNGSDEVLAHAFCALLNHPQPLLFPDISYSFYPVYCGLYQINYRCIPLDDRFQIQLDQYPTENGGIIFPNPNAPTGCLLALAELRALLQRNRDSVVVVDEAYIDFGGQSAIPLIAEFDNLLVIQTLSKSRSLAGLRVGFAVGHPQLIEALERVKNSFNSYPLDRLALAGAVASFADESYFQQQCQRVIATRARLNQSLTELGFEVLPSAANFVFCRHPDIDAQQIFSQLRARNILVRHFKLPRIDQFLRISIGTDAECQALTQALTECLPELRATSNPKEVSI